MQTWNPKDYAEHSSLQFGLARKLLDQLRLRGDEAILDLGCGDGKITVEIARRVPRGQAVGIDSSREMIGFARAKFPPAQYPNLEFAVMDAQAISFQEQFDLVLSNSALHWVADHRPILEGIFRCLKPGGQVIIQMMGRGGLLAMAPAVAKVIGDPRWKDGFKNFRSPHGFYGPEEYRAWVLAAGLRPLRVELVPRTIAHPGREAMIGWIRTTWLSLLGCVPLAEHGNFVVSLADAYLQMHPPGPDGAITIPSQRLVVEAEKNHRPEEPAEFGEQES